MMLTPEERADRATVNEAVRTQMTPLRPAGSADRYGVPTADENAPVAEERPPANPKDHGGIDTCLQEPLLWRLKSRR
jgi:hypothetical protein